MSKNKVPVIFSFFAGLGFLDLGFEKAGFPVVYVNELEKAFLDAYRYSREKLGLPEPRYGYHEGSVTDLLQGEGCEYLRKGIAAEKETGNIIGFIAGPPCPDFSVGGKNRGSKGDHGKLTSVYFDLVTRFEPDFFLFENVKGLYRTQKHRVFFEEMKKKAIEKGYVLTERLINTLEYGVPQYRERIILLGFKKTLLDRTGVKVQDGNSYMTNGLFPWTQYAKYDANTVFEIPWPERTAFTEGKPLEKPSGIIEELTVEYWFRQNNVDSHENAGHAFRPKAALSRFKTVDEGDDTFKSFKRLHRWRYSPTAAYGNNEVHLHPYRARRLSAAEVLAVQSLPKEFVLPAGMTLTSMFKGAGNGVPYLAAKAIAASILQFLGSPK